jgi:phosphopantetheine--protein transferase-like protein
VTDRWPDQASQEMVMRRYLNAVERAAYDERSPRARRPWLLGRIAAKDAARHLLWSQGRGPLFPAEITAGNDAQGRPWLRGPGGMAFTVSVAHTAGFGVALVLPQESGPVGIDIESIGAVTDTVVAASFTPEELALVEQLGGDRPEVLTRFWCAKEAAAKADGTGLGGRPKDFVVTAATGNTLTAATPTRTYRVATRVVKQTHVVAWTIPEEIE